jgi:hypothetical protein
MTYSWQALEPEFEYEATEHPCPECGLPLTRVVDSGMLFCIEQHGPFFLV